MLLSPIKKSLERVEVARQDSDTTLLLHLLYAGETLVKITTAAMVAAVTDDRERHRYRLSHRLVRADGLGEWSLALSDALMGPASQHLTPGAREDQLQLTQREGQSSWQYKSVHGINAALRRISPETDPVPTKNAAQDWFHQFVVLRNKTRGHGAPTPAICAALCEDVEASLRLVINNLMLYIRPWAYLYRNLSGKYRVMALAGDISCYDELKTAAAPKLPIERTPADGVHVHFGHPVRVELLTTNIDIADFYFPNGNFTGKEYELLSYISDNRTKADAGLYLRNPGELPKSETEGLRELGIEGENTFSNLPPMQPSYVPRTTLEGEVRAVLLDDRHPVVTLVGRGGIGKTSLALAVLHEVAASSAFELIAWFSARDIDLLSSGPKAVTPRVLTQQDIADEYVNLVGPVTATDNRATRISYFSDALTESPIGGPILFVFDNFETVRNPTDLFSWLDSRIRLPNKILITTRHRDFKADFPIEVRGMSEMEADKLMETISGGLGISGLLSDEYKDRVYQEADGHPYIIKVLLGEVAKARRLVKIERIVASKDDMLDALFERTYAGLSPSAKRVFMTLCRWRSLIPQIALEAVILRPANEKMDVEQAIEELIRSSFIEIAVDDDGSNFVTVPLVASVFGRRKFEVSPMKAGIEADVELLQTIGATQVSGVRHGIQSRIEGLFRHAAQKIAVDSSRLDEFAPMLEFICRGFPPAWLLLASLYEEVSPGGGVEDAKAAVRGLLERTTDAPLQRLGWENLARLCRQSEDWMGEIHALVESCKLPDTSFSAISNVVNRFNNLLRQHGELVDSEEKRIIVRGLITLMEARSAEADGTDLSRLAWLFLHLHEPDEAKAWTQEGLKRDSENLYCQRLAERLAMGAS